MVLFAAVAGAQNPPAPDGNLTGLLTLVNGDRMTVEIAGWDAAARALQVRHPDVRQPIEFVGEALQTFEVHTPAETEAASPWMVLLRGGDRIVGETLTWDEQGLHVRHPRLGALRLPAATVLEIATGADARPLYAGPFPGDEWLIPQGNRVVENRSLELPPQGAVSKRFEALPRRLRLDFRVSEIIQRSNLTVTLYGTKVAQPNTMDTGGYMLQMSGFGRVTLMRRTGQGFTNLGQQAIQWPAAEGDVPGVLFSIFMDAEEGRIALHAGGKPAAAWSDAARPELPGPFIAFQQFGAAMFELSDIRLSEWDGRVPDGEDQDAPRTDDLVRMTNDDTLTGEIQGIGPQGIALRMRFGDVTIPLDRVRRILRRTEPAAPPPAGAARVRLRDGSRFTLDPRAIAEGAFIGTDARVGALRLPLAEIRHIEWAHDAAARE